MKKRKATREQLDALGSIFAKIDEMRLSKSYTRYVKEMEVSKMLLKDLEDREKKEAAKQKRKEKSEAKKKADKMNRIIDSLGGVKDEVNCGFKL